ncbi:hypothetical protein ACFL96_05735 [Thermoproteota archaeon]
MFLNLLGTTLIIAFFVSCFVIILFTKPIKQILQRLVSDDVSGAWLKFLKFAMLIVGISSGVRIWYLEKYITPPPYEDAGIVILNFDRWVLEIYRTIIGTLSGIAWLLLLFFIFALIGFIIFKIFDLKGQRPTHSREKYQPSHRPRSNEQYTAQSHQQKQASHTQKQTQPYTSKPQHPHPQKQSEEQSKPLYRTNRKKINL